jgi:hypothetical protein
MISPPLSVSDALVIDTLVVVQEEETNKLNVKKSTNEFERDLMHKKTT